LQSRQSPNGWGLNASGRWEQGAKTGYYWNLGRFLDKLILENQKGIAETAEISGSLTRGAGSFAFLAMMPSIHFENLQVIPES
jgi:hypothetical protein